MTSYLNNGYDIIKYFAKFEKFIPHCITIPSFMTIRSQMPELDRGGEGGGKKAPPPNKIGCQNTPYKLGLIQFFCLTTLNACQFSLRSIYFLVALQTGPGFGQRSCTQLIHLKKKQRISL